jgi:hypothetical protein|tara:strand:+ start:420 stop:2219 length:1800 start_codon:yes stop_codon:yes gene_type:complete
MAEDNDFAYQVITGYYPTVASSINYKKAKGKKGSTGAKYRLEPGYTDSAIAKAKFQALDKFGKEAMLGEQIAGISELGEKRTVRHKTYKDKSGEIKDYYKWVGGSDKYKLYGDLVWYMAGQSADKSLEDYVASFGQNTPPFSNIYTKSQGNLVTAAKATAEEVFEKAVKEVAEDEVKEAIEEWNADGKALGMDMNWDALSPEEIGFKAGDYEYMPYETAMGAKDENGNLLYADQLDKMASDSKANPRDMVKIKNGMVESTIDVTEMAIDDPGQHGVTKVPKELKIAIKNVKAGNQGMDMKELKKAVELMFINTIKRDYNPVIRKLKAFAERATGKKGMKFKDVLREVKKAEGIAKKSKAGVPDIARATGMQLMDHARRSHYKNAYSEQALKYVVHNLASYGEKTNETFQDAHRVADYPDGQSVYAIVPMRFSDRTQLFLIPPVRDTEILTGYSATLALAVEHEGLSQEKSRVLMQQQKEAWMHSRVTNSALTSTGQAYTSVSKDIARASSLHSTSVSVMAGPALKKLLEGILRAPGHKMGKSFFEPILEKKLWSWNPGQGKFGGKGKRASRLTKGGKQGDNMFWALPYIGIQQSEYTGK